MRRPPLRLVTAGPGGLGQSSAGTRTGCLRWLDAGATTGGGSRPGRRLVCLRCASRKHGAGDRKAADGAPRGACVLPDARRAQSADLAGAPRGAPSPSMFFEGSKDGPARGLDKEYGRWRLSGANRASPARAALAGLSEK